MKAELNTNFLGNKKIIVFGLGLHGGGLALANWLNRQHADVIVTDKKSATDLRASLKKLKLPPNHVFLGQEPKLSWLKNTDLVLQNPGVPSEHFFIKAAKKRKIKVLNEAALFFLLVDRPIIGITGSKGKSTSTHLLGKILVAYFKNTLVGGNIRINPMFKIIDRIKSNSKIVLELSSWQLEGLKVIKKSPQVSLLTNITPEHLNRYASFSSYIAAKYLIFKYQNKNDLAILNWDDQISRQLIKKIKSQIYFFSIRRKVPRGIFVNGKKIFFTDQGKLDFITSIDKIKLQGLHNLQNILGAICVAYKLGIPKKIIIQIIQNYQGLSDRLEVVRTYKRIIFINDTTATAPVATIAALNSFPEKLIIIAGGSSKKLPVDNLAKTIKRKAKFCLLFAGDGSNELITALQKINYPKNKLLVNYNSMSKIVIDAFGLARAGDKIILSPGFASFGNFINEFDRGRQFVSWVKRIK